MKPEDVAIYLQDHPEFFDEHAEVLMAIQVPHPHGGRAIPLAERQIVSLREKTKMLEAKLRELVQFGEENDALGERVHRASLELIKAPHLEAMLGAIYYNLREDFSVPHVSMRMWSEASFTRRIRTGQPGSARFRRESSSSVLRRQTDVRNRPVVR
jgi:uncharacterized protein YigA (DUF484 family)